MMDALKTGVRASATAEVEEKELELRKEHRICRYAPSRWLLSPLLAVLPRGWLYGGCLLKHFVSLDFGQ